jgi:hypothetical protein
MATPTASVLRPAQPTRIAWLPVALVFVVGATIGAVAAASVFTVSQGDPAAGADAEPIGPNSQLTRLLGNMDAAADRGDTRLFVEFRQDLVDLIGAAGAAEYEALRGVETPTFHWPDNSGGI